jgi:hypothetical protein
MLAGMRRLKAELGDSTGTGQNASALGRAASADGPGR